MKEWLSDRKQRVVVGGEASENKDVESSVIQGSVLEGILFIIFIDDIDNFILALIKKFAHDTKIARVVGDKSQAEELQRDIAKLVAWAKNWKMQFNVSKCKMMHFGRRNLRHEYQMDGVKLEVGEEEKDLGVWTHCSMKLANQCEKAAKSANQALGMIFRNFHFRTKETIILLYKTFVWPRLEFSSAAWSPWTAKDEGTLKIVLKRMVRSLSDCQAETYEERLRKAGLTTLKLRRV